MTNNYIEILKPVGKNIAKYRKVAGLTQVKLALKLEKTNDYIYLIESGKRIPSLKTLAKISLILNVDIKEFFKTNV